MAASFLLLIVTQHWSDEMARTESHLRIATRGDQKVRIAEKGTDVASGQTQRLELPG
jgi:hypothetical protein